MPYDNIPAENAPAIPARPDEYTYFYNITGIHPDGKPYSTIDDLDMFDVDAKTGNRAMLDYLDRIVTDVKIKGESTGPSVRHKGIPYACLKDLMAGVGNAIKAANDTKN